MKNKNTSEILNNELFEAFATASEQVYVYVCDMAENLTRWSLNAVDYFDIPSEYLENTQEVWMERIHPDDRAMYQTDISKVFSGEKQHHSCEYRALNSKGEYVWLKCRGTVLCDEEGTPRTFAGMMTRLDVKNKYDPLTNLKTIYEFNKNDFSKGTGSLLLIGIDSFRTVINNFGYGFGNKLLVDFCREMERYCRGDQKLYRLGGDEFIFVSPGYGIPETDRLFQDIKFIAQHTGSWQEKSIILSISGGAVLYPEDGTDREELISNMEHSLEHAKRFSRGELVLFSQEIAAEHNRTNELRRILTDSIKNDFHGFELYFQPIVDVKSHGVCSCEALLRWSDDRIKNVTTSEVIRVMEQSGEIRELGYWITEEFMRKIKPWQEKYPDLMAGVNASYLQFKESDFVEFIIDKAVEYRLDPNRICIELTESSDVDDFENLTLSFRKLQSRGFKISLDDFGIAYSTLLLIRNLPADSVKIDHSFIIDLAEHNKKDLAIIESIITLCRTLDIRVVAEGVETEEILEIISQYPISMIQGYYFAKPMPAAEFEKYMDAEI
ncbi:MAG: GGDEF and EAL domain-containing protein [Bacillota bacterium]|nr:GGDEF and EAL domain-containing protein [Bacillota bacterium]